MGSFFSQIKKYSVIVVGLSIVSGLLLFIFAPQIIRIVLGPDFSEAVSVFQILAFVPAIIMISNIAGIQIMLNLDYKKEFNRIIFSAALLNIILMFVLVPSLSYNGAALSILITETGQSANFRILKIISFSKFWKFPGSDSYNDHFYIIKIQ